MLNRFLRSFHPNPSVLLKHLVAELLVADTKIQRMEVGKKLKEQKPKFKKLKEEIQAMKEKYIKGYYAGVLGRRKYLTGLGFKLNRLDVETERVERVDNDCISEQTNSLEGRYPGELAELISQRFGEKSFVDRNHPYQDRQHGVSEQAQASRVEDSFGFASLDMSFLFISPEVIISASVGSG